MKYQSVLVDDKPVLEKKNTNNMLNKVAGNIGSLSLKKFRKSRIRSVYRPCGQ